MLVIMSVSIFTIAVILYTYIYIFTIPYLFYFQNQDVNFVPEDDCILLLSCIDDLLFDENELWPLDLKPGRFSLKLEQICTFKCTCCLLLYKRVERTICYHFYLSILQMNHWVDADGLLIPDGSIHQ